MGSSYPLDPYFIFTYCKPDSAEMSGGPEDGGASSALHTTCEGGGTAITAKEDPAELASTVPRDFQQGENAQASCSMDQVQQLFPLPSNAPVFQTPSDHTQH